MADQRRWFTLPNCSYVDVDKGSRIERRYFIGEKRVNERAYRKHQAKLDEAQEDWEAYKATLPDFKNTHVLDRDGRWALENHGRGHACTQFGEQPVYFQSMGEARDYCAARGETIADFQKAADVKSHKQAQPYEHPDPVKFIEEQLRGS